MYKNIYFIGAGVLLVIVLVSLSLLGKKPQLIENTSWSTVQEWLAQAQNLQKDKDLVKAKELYQKILSGYSDYDKIEQVQQQLETINMELILSNTPVDGKAITHEVEAGDNLGELAKKYGTTIELIKLSNNLKGDLIRVGQRLRIWQGNFNLLVDKSQTSLILKDGNEVIKSYTVSTGENRSTPVGTFKIVSKLVDPVWFNRGVIVPPDSPANVLGSRWLGLDLPGYGIHGTIEPKTIGQNITAGCIRMRNEDVEEIYNLIPLGTEVTVMD